MKIYVLATAMLWTTAAYAGELTLPFRNQDTPLWQGWHYDDGSYHGAIDYGTACGTEIVAAADGYAISWYQPYDPNNPNDYSYGEYVLMYHPAIKRYTLYAHLSSWASNIPRLNRISYSPGSGWVWVTRGSRVGTAGKTGTQVCHLHFEVTTRGYATGRVDAYGLFSTHWYYPGCGQNTGAYYFTRCPPVPPSSTPPPTYTDISRAGDFNGDGRYDIARFYPSNGRWDVLLSTGSSFTQQTWFTSGHGIGSSWQGVGDVDGDGRDDAIVYFDASGHAYVALSNGASFNNWYQVTAAAIWQNVMQNKFLGDVNGDCRDDFIGYENGNWYVALSNGYQFQWPQWGILGHGVGSTKRMVADVTADGRVDAFAYFAQDDSWYGAGGQANGTFGTGYGLWARYHGDNSNDQLMGDIDGNGAEDAWCFWHSFNGWSGGVTVWNSYGIGTGGFRPNNNPRTQGQAGGSTLRVAADFTGDGRDDFGYVVNGAWYVAISDGYNLWPASRWK